MLLHDARRPARVSPTGELVTLEDQDRSLWNAAEIAEGEALLTSALRLGVVGLGWWASAHHLPALTALPTCRVEAPRRA